MISTAGKALAALGVAGALVAGGTAAASAQSSSDQGPVKVHVSKHSVVTGPHHVRPGLIRIDVTGAKNHSLQLATSRHGAGRATLAKDVNEMAQTNKAVDLDHDFKLLGGASTGSTLFVYLKPGRYFLADSSAPVLKASTIKVLTVSGHKSHAAGYRPSGTIRAIHEMTWAKSPKSVPASGLMRFDNKATDSHFIVLARLKAGKTLADVKKLLTGQENEQDVLYSGARNNFDNGVVSSGRTETVSYDLHPGRYVLACFWPDENGMPHAMMGMIRTIKLT